MLKKINQLNFVLSIFLAGNMFSQNIINDCIISPGDVFTTVQRSAALTLTAGGAGQGQIWDYTDFSDLQGYVDTVMSANQSATSLFPSATLMRRSGYDFRCYKMGANGLEYLGNNNTLNYSDPQLIAPSSLAFGASLTDTWTYTVSLGSNVVSSATAKVNWQADATGAIFTPGGNFYNTVRVRSVNDYTVTSNTQAPKVYNHIDYHWFKNGIHAPVFSLYTWTYSGSSQKTVEYLFFSSNFTSLSKSASDENLRIFPNPSSEVIKVVGFYSVIKINITDFCGRLVRTSLLQYGEELNVRDLNEGLYCIETIDESGNRQSKKIQISR